MIIQQTFVEHEPFAQVPGEIADTFWFTSWVDMQLLTPRRRKISPTTSSSTWNFFRRPTTTVRNVGTIYRWALELVIILLLLRFHSAIGVVTITRKSDVYRF